MYFTTIAFMSLMGMIGANAVPHLHAEMDTETSPRLKSPLVARDTYDCKGSSLCRSLQVRACDDAVNNKIIRNDDVNYGAPGSGRPRTGECSAIAGGFGCGVFIQGQKNCARTGNQIWHDYQDIRGNGCKICGSKHWGDGCLTTINYVSGC